MQRSRFISNIQKDTIEASEAIDKSRNLAYENQKSSKALSNSMEAINSSFTIVSEKSEITVAQMKKQLDRALQIQQSMLSANEMAENSLSSASTLVEISKKLDTLSVALNSTISHQN